MASAGHCGSSLLSQPSPSATHPSRGLTVRLSSTVVSEQIFRDVEIISVIRDRLTFI